MKFTCPAAALFLLAASSLIEISSDQSRFSTPKLLLTQNAYNPIPSPDGNYIAFVITGWNEGLLHGTGRASPTSHVGLMDSTGKLLTRSLAPAAFLASWSRDSHAVVCYRDGHYAVRTLSGVSLETGELPQHTLPIFMERVAFLNDLHRAVWVGYHGTKRRLETASQILAPPGDTTPFLGWDWVAPSPDGRYIATLRDSPSSSLWVYDRTARRWANLGEAANSPDEDWDYMKPA